MGVLIVPKATTAERTGITPAAGEVIFDETQSVIYFGDGSTLGGLPSMTSVFPVPTQHASGTAALPGVTFSGDTNTGFWRPAADTLAASTNGTERLRIDSTGNVLVAQSSTTLPGLGNTTTGISLNTNGSIHASRGGASSSFNRNTNNGGLITLYREGVLVGSLDVTTGSVAYTASSGNFLGLGAGGTERLRIDSTGNVGIGTSAPDMPLVVQAAVAQIKLQDSANRTLRLKAPDGADTFARIGPLSTHSMIVHSGTSGALAFETAGSERMRITSTGNVGIGTSVPLSKLHVEGTVRSSSAGASFTISGAGSLTTAISGGGAAVTSGTFVAIETAASERMRITPDGSIGVGTTSPSAAACLDLFSLKGFLPPRMTTTQRDAITSPPNGLILYNSTTDKLQVRTGGAWVDLH
jgi:hypothetical protein